MLKTPTVRRTVLTSENHIKIYKDQGSLIYLRHILILAFTTIVFRDTFTIDHTMFILNMLMAGVLPRPAAGLRGGHGAGPPPAAARPRHRQHQHLTPGGGGSNPRNCDQRATPWAQKPLIKLDVDQVASVSLVILQSATITT